MTKRLYYHDAKLCEFTANIITRQDTERGPEVCLDETAFYPTSGGQPHDTGSLDSIPVIDVWEDEGEVWHLLERMPDNDRVTGKVDWGRRFDHTQQHTGQHLLSAAFVRELNAQTISFHLGSDISTIDLDIPDLTWEAAFQVEEAANQIIWEDRPVAVHIATADELANIPLRKPPQVTGKIRIIWVEDYDASACGGTHVGRTGEIGAIKITAIERYKGGVRVSFLCGQRALHDYRRVLRSIQQASADLSVHQDELREAITRIQEEAKTSRRELKQARGELMQIEADRLWESTPELDGVRRIAAHWVERSFADVRAVASRLRERPHTLLLLAVSEEKGVRIVCARSDDLVDLDAAAILRAAMEPLGGRGGGSATMAQGGAGWHSHEAILETLSKAEGRGGCGLTTNEFAV
ncbi:MAG: alanyl-tRNA editing protein [Chloroflexi bacterium]|nr:alanyl-tRNA editing protein [Chloroflexota bacterium]